MRVFHGVLVCAVVIGYWSLTQMSSFAQVYKTEEGVTCIGYSDMPSRLANTASTLFANNAVKLFSSAGPFSTG